MQEAALEWREADPVDQPEVYVSRVADLLFFDDAGRLQEHGQEQPLDDLLLSKLLRLSQMRLDQRRQVRVGLATSLLVLVRKEARPALFAEAARLDQRFQKRRGQATVREGLVHHCPRIESR